MSILRKTDTGYVFWCEGCSRLHHIWANDDSKSWKFNGDLEKPTFSPSYLLTGTVSLTDEQYDRIMAGENIEPTPLVCHSFIREGNIEYLGDCSHKLAGQTVPLMEIKSE